MSSAVTARRPCGKRPGKNKPSSGVKALCSRHRASVRSIWFGKGRQSARLITCTTDGRRLTKNYTSLATGPVAHSTASRWNTSIPRAATPCRRCPPTFECFVLAKFKTHRHNNSVVYHTFRSSGVSVIDGQKFDWQQGDCFVVPLWSWHSHQNGSKSDEAILFPSAIYL